MLRDGGVDGVDAEARLSSPDADPTTGLRSTPPPPGRSGAVPTGAYPVSKPPALWARLLTVTLQFIALFVLACGIGFYLGALTRTFLIGWHIGWRLWW